MAKETEQLASFIVEYQTEDIPERVTSRLKWLVLDNLAAGVLGARQPWFGIAEHVANALGGNAESHVFGTHKSIDCSKASFLNGIAIGGYEVDHIYGGSHPGASVFPAVLALAESRCISGRELLRAMAIGYEISGRVSAAQTNAVATERGFHNGGLCGVFGAAAGCAVVLGLPIDQTLSALGIAGSSAGGLGEFAWTGAMTKRLHLGRAAQMGLEAALLAESGFTGPPTIFEGRKGFLQAYSPHPKVEELVKDLGTDWFVDKIRIKQFPSHVASQVYIPELLAWRENNNDDSSQLDGITIRTSLESSEERFLEAEPDTILGAQYSLPFAIAIVIVRGVEGLIDVNHETVDNKEIKRISRSIKVFPDDRFSGIPIVCGGEIAFHQGEQRIISVVDALKVPSLSELELICRKKFALFNRDSLSDRQIDAIEIAIEKVDQLLDVRKIMDLL